MAVLNTVLARVFAVLALVAVLAGCAGSGPVGRDFVGGGRSGDSQYALVPIDAYSIAIVSSWHRPSLSAVFGDYRRPAVQRIGIGDSVQINIWEAGAGGIFSASPADRTGTRGGQVGSIPEQAVAGDGTISVPYAGRIRVAGKTPQEIEAQIVSRLQGKSVDPQALVTLTRNLTNSVTVTGDVTNGARVPLNNSGDRVLDVVTAAGGIKSSVAETFIVLTREGQSINVPMQALLSNSRENVYVRPGDVITVVRMPQSFTAVGATGRQAHVGFDAGGLTLEEALGKAGGLLDERADPRGVFVLRYEPSALVQRLPNVPPHLLALGVVPVVYQIDMREPASLFHARRFAMRDKDILYVSNAPLTEVEKVFRVLGQLTSPGLSAYSAVKRYD
jgi:polysaccharide export outer membrane protein